MEDCKLFRRNRQCRRGSGVALYIRVLMLCSGLGMIRCISLWARIGGADILVRFFWRLPNKEEETDQALLRAVGRSCTIISLCSHEDLQQHRFTRQILTDQPDILTIKWLAWWMREKLCLDFSKIFDSISEVLSWRSYQSVAWIATFCWEKKQMENWAQNVSEWS